MASAESNPSTTTAFDHLRRLLYISSYHGIYITGNPDVHFARYSHHNSFTWAKSAPKQFVEMLKSGNADAFLPRRQNLFYILAQALSSDLIPAELKLELKALVLEFVKDDDEFFYFLKYFTSERKSQQRISNSIMKVVTKFYRDKTPADLANSVAKHNSLHGWTHKDLIKLIHYKCETPAKIPIINYILFGPEKLQGLGDPQQQVLVNVLRKHHELKTTEDVKKVVRLVKELHATIEQVNMKLAKNEDVWTAVIQEMSVRDVLRQLHKFYKLGFLKHGSGFQTKLIASITDADKIKRCKLHPIEVFIYLKVFEKGGKVLDPKFLEYLQKKNIKEETMKRITTPIEPKNQAVVQNINKCLMLSYNNVTTLGKRIMITIDVTEKSDTMCFHNKRISCYEAIYTMCRFFSKVEKNVIVAVFKDSQISLVDISKCYSAQKAVEKFEENKATYSLPQAPLEWASNKKKQIDLFINFMSTKWQDNLPKEIKDKNDKFSDHLSKYSKKLKSPNTKVVKIFLGGRYGAQSENSKHIISMCGFSADIPRVLDAFCRDKF